MQGFLAASQTLDVSLLFWLLFYILEIDWVFMCLGENEMEAGDKETDTQIELVIASNAAFSKPESWIHTGSQRPSLAT